jgi:hypothetical protein
MERNHMNQEEQRAASTLLKIIADASFASAQAAAQAADAYRNLQMGASFRRGRDQAETRSHPRKKGR